MFRLALWYMHIKLQTVKNNGPVAKLNVLNTGLYPESLSSKKQFIMILTRMDDWRRHSLICHAFTSVTLVYQPLARTWKHYTISVYAVCHAMNPDKLNSVLRPWLSANMADGKKFSCLFFMFFAIEAKTTCHGNMICVLTITQMYDKSLYVAAIH